MTRGEAYERVREALERLVDLKGHKEKCGKTIWYEDQQPKAWQQAREALALLPALKQEAVAGQPDERTALECDVEEYLHWRKVNPQIKGGENYLKRLRQSLADLPNREPAKLIEKPKKCDPGPCDFRPGIPLMCCVNCEEFY